MMQVVKFSLKLSACVACYGERKEFGKTYGKILVRRKSHEHNKE